MGKHRFLVTGALGCIGAWVVRNLVQSGNDVTIYDLGTNDYRLRMLLTGDELAAVQVADGGDVTNLDMLRRAFADHGITHVIHLAALQVPFCRAQPSLGAQVNVTGTVNVFEAARHAGLRHVVYASSIAVYGPRDQYPPGLLRHDALQDPRNHYGVYKQANEATARIYYAEAAISSIALRPYTIYGPGRDQGMTAAPSLAMRAAANGEAYHIPFGGMSGYQHADDVAKLFIRAAELPYVGAGVFNLKGEIAHMRDVVSLIEAVAPEVKGKITFDDTPLPLPDGADDTELIKVFGEIPNRPLRTGIEETIAFFSRLAAVESHS
jgi:nucleoside-diphosphate-sugar epimerase